jgi:exonuclease SbcC
MKILSVRGENLASLPRFSLDLQDGPLAETGIFVITGPTGAGKSTLLDAICLALYDNTPRLVRVGPQSIVRQSAVEAFAEVDFVCGQGRKWRATWHVQRARKKPGGQWQDQTLRLTDLESGKLVSDHRKMDTLRRIEELVGLSFSQFCRSVLLAQGDFALFLQAKGDERAKLLEKITGTEIYAQLSAAAFRRSKEEVEALEALRTEAARYKGLEPAERERLCAERERLTARRQILVEQVERDKRLCAYYETAAQLRAELAAAAADLAEAERRSEEAEGLRRELRCYEAARALEPALQALDQAEAALRDAEAELTGATARAEGGAGRCAEAEAALAGAEQAALAARAEAASRAEELALARELDLRLRGADGRLAETRALLAAAVEEAAQRRRGAEELARRLRQAGARREQVERWLGERPGLRALCEGWSGWQAVLDGLCEAHGRLRALSAERAGLEERHGQLRLAYHEVQERHGLALAARQGRREELAEAQARRAAHREAHPPAQREERGARLLALGAELREAAAGLAEAARLDREAREQERLAQGEAAAEQACLARAAAAAAALPAAREAVGAIEEELRLLRATQQLAARRPELLVAGRPCPLCGSTEHPAAAAAGSASALAPLGSIDEEVARRAAEHEAGRARLQALGVEEAAAQREAQGHRALRQRAEAAALGARAALAQRFDLQGQQGQQGSLRPLLQALQLGEAPAAEAMAGWLAQAAAEVERRGREVEAERLALEQVGREDAALQANVERRQEAEARASAEVERLALSLGQAEAVRAEAERALLLHEEREAQARAALAAAMRELVPLLDGLEGEGGPGHAQAALARDPAAVRERLRGLVREWQGRRREQDGIAEEVRALEGQQAAALGAAAQAEAARLSRQREEEGCAAEVARLTRERAGVLGGQPVADWERRLQGAVAQAEDAVARARAVREAAAREQAAAQEAATAAARRLQGAVTALEAARAALEAARVRAGDPVQGMALPEVRRWLGLGEEFRRRRAEEIEKRRDELVQRRAAHADRERRLAEHLQRAAAEGVAAEEGGEELAAAALRRSQGELDEVNGARFEVELQLSQDEQTAAHRQGILGEIRKREREADAWGRLNELIGSADGKKFRQFAQSMTLDTLLWHSNGHLRQLRPRYRIEREPGAGGDMELRVVDQDMGGEAFLVSLALALGLSSLSARDVKVESLFIDEGFGTLDRDTLEVAISTLEQLQSDGRQVGLISHVADLADRIGYQVLVEPRGVGCSQVTVPEARGR